MTIIYHHHKVKLEKKKKGHYELMVPWESSQKKFWVNFPFPLLKVTSEKRPDDKHKIFYFRANSVETLPQYLQKHKQYLNYDNCLYLLYDVGNQLQALEGFRHGIPFIDMSEIIVVDDRHYFYMNAEKMLPIEDDEMTIDIPYKKTPFFSPEFKNITSLPAQISYKTSFYSLAAIVSFCLTKQHIGEDPESYKKILEEIDATKLYWALGRMLEENPKNRYFLII